MKDYLTDEQVEQEIERLKQSPLVKLAKKEEAVRNRRRQYMYCLRTYERRGRELERLGVTIEGLEALAKGCDEEAQKDAENKQSD